MKPIIKWVGGKSALKVQIIGAFSKLDFKTYAESFLGGGAIAFHLAENFRGNFYLNDINHRLIWLYEVMRDSLDDFVDQYNKEIQDFYRLDSLQKRRACYCDYQNFFNLNKNDEQQKVKLAVCFLILNKLCFNGLYRENKKGDFNSPFSKEKVVIPELDLDNLNRMRSFLQRDNVYLSNLDFRAFVDLVKDREPRNCLYYFDPPYLPVGNNQILKYSHSGFSREDYQELKILCNKLTGSNHCLISNAKVQNEEYIQGLDSSFHFETEDVLRNIAAKTESRTIVKEVLISNF